jgi:hypothetical protein
MMPGWLAGRLDLFERICLPSVAQQTQQNFSWLVYLDENTPESARERIESYREVRSFTPLYTPLFPSTGWRDSVLRLLGEGSFEFVLTSNLDSDDALGNDYMSRVMTAARAVRARSPIAINVTNGFVLSGDKLFTHRHRSNAFTNLLEPNGAELRTANAIRHMEMNRHVPVVQETGEPSWMQVVHGKNVSNRIRGKRAVPAEAEGRFPAHLVRDIATPSRFAILFDHGAVAPWRLARDLLFQAARRAWRGR